MDSSFVTDNNEIVLPSTNNVRQSSYSVANSNYCCYTIETITRVVESTIEIRVTGPHVYRFSGQNHHLMGSLLPTTGEKPKFVQLSIYDTENEVMNRLKALSKDNTLSSTLEFDVVSELVNMFDECNDLTKVFRMARDHFRVSEFIPIRLRLIRSCSNDSNVYFTNWIRSYSSSCRGSG
ncbi:hypothetical protein Dsin_029041 [Dipteronia sinensis]|uniref:Uncharacterized protein n=1 Tax=Dipteronia sinensis TaxID=43782 RepID=A0AAD9ZRP8_9ROSI|nr:hypothetical protein Dsin_029041 [Dipteronia sinensis]